MTQSNFWSKTHKILHPLPQKYRPEGSLQPFSRRQPLVIINLVFHGANKTARGNKAQEQKLLEMYTPLLSSSSLSSLNSILSSWNPPITNLEMPIMLSIPEKWVKFKSSNHNNYKCQSWSRSPQNEWSSNPQITKTTNANHEFDPLKMNEVQILKSQQLQIRPQWNRSPQNE